MTAERAAPIAPTLDEVLQTLRARLPELRTRYGVKSLGVFGSYVHGTQRGRSDVDLLVEYEEDAKRTLAGLIALQEELSDALGLRVDLVDRNGLKPYIGKRILREVVWLLGNDRLASRRRVQEKASPQQGDPQVPANSSTS